MYELRCQLGTSVLKAAVNFKRCLVFDREQRSVFGSRTCKYRPLARLRSDQSMSLSRFQVERSTEAERVSVIDKAEEHLPAVSAKRSHCRGQLLCSRLFYTRDPPVGAWNLRVNNN